MMAAADARAVCVLCRGDRRAIRLGVFVCKHHWRLVVRVARAARTQIGGRAILTDPELVETARRLEATVA